MDILSSVIDELETECRRLTGFLNWFQQCIGNSGSFYRDKKNFRFLQKGAPAAESNSVRLANGLRECGSKIKRISRELSGVGQEVKRFQLEDPKNLEIIDDLNGYLGGLKYAIRQLKEQLSEKEAKRPRKEEEAKRLIIEIFDEDFLDTEPLKDLDPSHLTEMSPDKEHSEQPNKENGQ